MDAARSLLLMLSLLAWLQPSFAAPKIELVTRFYPVTGHDLPAIYRSLQQNGPSGEGAGSYHANTQWDIQWGYRWIEAASQCRLTGIDVSIKISYLLPKLQDYDSLDARVRDAWDRFYSALVRHEEHHKEYGIRAANELEQTLLLARPDKCFGLKNQLDRMAREVIDKYDRLEREYDQRTNHGVNEGVILRF